MGNSDDEKTRESRLRGAFHEENFTLEGIEFRPYTLATLDYVQAFELQDLLSGSTKSEFGMLDDCLTLAWALSEDESLVRGLAIDCEMAETPEEKKACRTRLRHYVVEFKARIPVGQLPQLVKKMSAISQQVEAASFELADRDTGMDSDEEVPPGN